MTNEKMRAEFEKWAISHGIDISRIKIRHEMYRFCSTRLIWDGWKASRENIEVELPEKCPELTIYNMALDDIKQKLTEQGFKVK